MDGEESFLTCLLGTQSGSSHLRDLSSEFSGEGVGGEQVVRRLRREEVLLARVYREEVHLVLQGVRLGRRAWNL